MRNKHLFIATVLLVITLPVYGLIVACAWWIGEFFILIKNRRKLKDYTVTLTRDVTVDNIEIS